MVNVIINNIRHYVLYFTCERWTEVNLIVEFQGREGGRIRKREKERKIGRERVKGR